MKRKQRTKAIWIATIAALAMAAIVIPLLVFAGSEQATFTATLYSNVIRFEADGVASLRVTIYDLSENELWSSGQVMGDFADWDRTNERGERLANGYYIYLAQGWDSSDALALNKTGKIVLLPGDEVELRAAPPEGIPGVDFADDTSSVTPKVTYTDEELILNNGSIFYQMTGTSRYKMGISGVGGFQFMDLIGGNDFYIVSSGGWATAAFDFDSGSLSLGTAAQSGRLTVAGTSFFDDDLYYRRGGTNRYKMGISGVGGFQYMDLVGGNKFYIVNSSGVATSGFDFDSGALGLGVAVGAAQLHVVGSGIVTGNFGVGTTNVTDRLTIQGATGNLIACYPNGDRDAGDAVFRVESDGDVYADGTVYAKNHIEGGSADIAERISVSEWVEAGDVVEIDPVHSGFFRKATGLYSRRVAGIISTSPGVILGNDIDPTTERWDDNRPVLAIAGRVPVKASTENGAIAVGDLLVSSSVPGVAMRGDPAVSIGAVVGKAMELLADGEGVIMAQVTLR
jgi:hypothetical protein